MGPQECALLGRTKAKEIRRCKFEFIQCSLRVYFPSAQKKELWDRTTGGDAVGSSFAFSGGVIPEAHEMVS